MSVKPLAGLAGVLLAAVVAQLNDQLISLTLPDLRGGMGLSVDEASWFRTMFHATEVMGMAVAPSLALIFSPRRFILGIVALSCASTLLMIPSRDLTVLYVLRLLQGLAAGFTIPLLMATALRVLTPPIRLYGLALYALTATFTPYLAGSLAALWTDRLSDWRLVLLQALPLSILAALLVWWGMPQDKPNHDRARTFDFRGALLVALGFGSLSLVLEQGDRLDWFQSTTILLLAATSAIAIPLFLVRERHAVTPLVKFSLLKRRNFAFGMICFILSVIITLAASSVPLSFLSSVRGYRPAQTHILTLYMALMQIALLPAVAWILDHRHVDARLVAAAGLVCMLAGCLAASRVDPSWGVDQFLPLQALQAVGQALVFMPLLMIGTNAVRPDEGPYAAALFNMPRVIAQGAGTWALDLVARWRGGLHQARLTDRLGFDGRSFPSEPKGYLTGEIQRQVATMVAADTFILLGGLVLVLLAVLAILPERTLPPRLALAAN